MKVVSLQTDDPRCDVQANYFLCLIRRRIHLSVIRSVDSSSKTSQFAILCFR